MTGKRYKSELYAGALYSEKGIAIAWEDPIGGIWRLRHMLSRFFNSLNFGIN
jgi:hypothetical protein